MKSIVKIFVCITLISLCVLSFFACTQGKDEATTVEIVDMVGDTVTVKKNPTKVACVSRTSYDLLVAFGLSDNIDGAYSKNLDNAWAPILYPDSANHYKYDYEPSYELLLSRGVDLVLCPEQRIAEGLREHGITAITISLYGNPTFDNSVTFIADLAIKLWDDESVKQKATEWKTNVQTTIASIQSQIPSQETQKKLFYVRGDKDKGINYTDTKGSFVEYAYRILGFNCMSATLGYDGTRPSAESICEFNPDIFVMGGVYQNKHVEDIKSTAPYTTLAAVQNNQIYTIPMGFTQMEQINAFTAEFFCDQANKLYPDVFDFDVKSMMKNSIKKYFGTDVTDTQVEYMLAGLSPTGGNLY